MKYSHQEGEIRPLYSSVPKNQCFWPWAVVGSYPLAYFYLRCILFGEAGRYRGWAMTAFAVVFLLRRRKKAQGQKLRLPNEEESL